jgi:hypothetical protein
VVFVPSDAYVPRDIVLVARDCVMNPSGFRGVREKPSGSYKGDIVGKVIANAFGVIVTQTRIAPSPMKSR